MNNQTLIPGAIELINLNQHSFIHEDTALLH